MQIVSINPQSFTLYPFNPDRANLNQRNENSLKNLEIRKNEGILSHKGQKRLKQTLNWMVYCNYKDRINWKKYKTNTEPILAFLTLTLSSSQVHSDQTIKTKLLNQLLTELREKYHGIKYVWRAEKQKNKSIHFHLLLDRFIPYKQILNQWNRIQDKLNYVGRYSNRFRKLSLEQYHSIRSNQKNYCREQARTAFYKGRSQGWKNPNSVDIRRTKKVKNLAAYIAKYVSKSDSEQKIKGRIWGSSRTLSKLKTCQHFVTNSVDKILEEIEKIKDLFIIQSEYFTTVFLRSKHYKMKAFRPFFQLIDEYIYQTLNPI